MEPQDNLNQPAEPTPTPVSFPSGTARPKPKRNTWIWVILIVLIAAAIGGFFILKGSSEIEPLPSPTPQAPIEEPLEEPSPASSAAPSTINKTDIEIKVLNGTGVPGEAAYLETQLKNIGYTNVETGNYTSSSVTSTTVTFSKEVTTDMKEEITDKLETLYADVEVKTGTVSGADIQIVTGPRKGASPKPSASPSATPKAQ